METVELLPWDSDFFGFSIARVTIDTLTPSQATAIDAYCAEAGIRCIYFLARSDDPATIRVAEAYGFRLVDIRLTLSHTLTNRSQAEHGASNSIVRPVRPGDIEQLQIIARNNHRDTRFFADGNFDPAACGRLYETWIRQSCLGGADRVFVAEWENEAAGYTSCHFDPIHRTGKIGMVGVKPEAQGKGLGQMLISEALRWFRQKETGRVRVVTQGRNTAAQRLYQGMGFKTESLCLWYHKWFI